MLARSRTAPRGVCTMISRFISGRPVRSAVRIHSGSGTGRESSGRFRNCAAGVCRWAAASAVQAITARRRPCTPTTRTPQARHSFKRLAGLPLGLLPGSLLELPVDRDQFNNNLTDTRRPSLSCPETSGRDELKRFSAEQPTKKHLRGPRASTQGFEQVLRPPPKFFPQTTDPASHPADPPA